MINAKTRYYIDSLVNTKNRGYADSIVVLNSGGLDSTILVAFLKELGFNLHHLFINYGQNSMSKERKSSKGVFEKYNNNDKDTWREVKLSLPWLSESTHLVNGTTEDLDNPDFENTPLNAIENGEYVPTRNAMFLTIAGSLAESLCVPVIACAFDGEEDPIFRFPMGGTTDKHQFFVDKVADMLDSCSANEYDMPLTILTPLMGMTKKDIIEFGLKHGADKEDILNSWSCYNSTSKPCGVCSACKIRNEALENIKW